jgi:YesN/AraC family two-component response regulator
MLGYTVTGKTSSLEALEAFYRQPDAFDLVITDQTMPHLTGTQLARELKDIRPDLPVILCTGFSDQINPKDTAAMGVHQFLMKPLDLQHLTTAIKEVMEE